MDTIGEREIARAVGQSGLTGYAGQFRPLGGGELNDTFLLVCDSGPVVLRVARYADEQGLRHEAKALSLLSVAGVPRLIYFNPEHKINNRTWILETGVSGTTVGRLSVKQFENLGKLLAKVHQVEGDGEVIDPWEIFLNATKGFGDESYLLSHPDLRLRTLIERAQQHFEKQALLFEQVSPRLVHGDATPSNVLVSGDEVALIDWEFSRFNDPMAEFSTIYYDDIEYNQGKWRIKITPEERAALFTGYEAAGGTIALERLNFWMDHDKLGAAVFLYWRINESGRAADEAQMTQYVIDLENLTASLERSMSLWM